MEGSEGSEGRETSEDGRGERDKAVVMKVEVKERNG